MRRKLQLLLTLLLAWPIGMLAAGTTWQSATTLAIDGSASGSLSGDRIEEWYKIAVPSNGELTITSSPTGGLDLQYTVVYALDAGNNLRERGSKWGGKEVTSFTVVDCAAGTYYVRMKRNGGEGNYTVTSSFKATSSFYPNDSEPNDDWTQTTKLLTNHVPTTGQLGYLYYNDTDKLDWYKLEVPENGTVKVTTTPHGNLDMGYTVMYALDAENILRERGSVWVGKDENAFTVVDCAKGTYYIKMQHNGGEGGYTLQYDFTPTSVDYANDNEPNDDWTQATKMLRNRVDVTGHLGYLYYNDTDKEDWYKLELSENGSVKVATVPHGNLDMQNTVLYALDAENILRERGSAWVGRDENTFNVVDCAKGTYYIKVRQNTGEGAYTLQYDFTPTSTEYANDAEPNDDWTHANEIALGRSKTGHLGYRHYNDTDVEDWYKLEVPENGELTVITIPHGNLDMQNTVLYALDAENILRERGYLWVGREENSFTVVDCAKGTYYIKVRQNGGEGAYTLRTDFKPISSIQPNDAEPNNTWQQAKNLNRGATTTGHLGYVYYNDTDKEDWYKITVPRDGTIHISWTPFINLDLQYTVVYALDAGNNLRERGSLWGGKEPGEIVIPDAKPGAYYVKMAQNGGEGAYTLRYVFEQNNYATDAEPNDALEQAVTLQKGVTVAGHLGYFYYDDRDGDDYYKLTLSAKGTVEVNYQPTGELDLGYVTLFNSEGRDKGSIWGGKTAGTLKVENLDAGTYYVRVRRNGGYGTYFLCYGSTIGTVQQQTPLPDEDVTETDTKPGTDWNNGGSLAPNSSTDKHMNSNSPTHWYSFTVAEDGRADITLALRNNLDISGWWVYARKDNGDMEQRGAIDLATNETGTMTIKDLAPGKYYIKIQHFSGDGDYTLTGRFTPCSLGNDTENNDTWQKAQTIKPGQSLTGHMGYCYVNDDRDTDDWYKVEVPYDGIVTLTLKPQAELDFYAIEFGFHNTEVNGISRQGNSVDEGAPGLTVTLKQMNVAAGTYYLHIPHCPGGQGGYTLSYDLAANAYGNDVEPNDTWQQAQTTIAKGSTYTGHLGYVKYNVTDEHDWYMIKVAQKSNVDVTIQLCKELDLYGMTLYRFNGSDVESVGAVDPYFGETKTLSVKDLDAGTYYIDVNYCAGQGHYWLSYSSVIGTPENPKPDDPTPGPGPDDPTPGGVTLDEFTCWFYDNSGNVVTMGFKLAEKPQVRFTDEGQQIQVKTNNGSYQFDTPTVVKFTLNGTGGDPAVGIEETVAPAQPAAEGSISRQGEDMLLLSGFKPGQLVQVYAVGGRLVEQYRTDSAGSLEISLGSLAKGLYIVKSGSVTIKITKK